MTLHSHIQQTLNTNYTPLLFRELESYNLFLENLWLTIRDNVTHPTFDGLVGATQRDVLSALNVLEYDNSLAIERIFGPAAAHDKSIRNKITHEIEQFYTTQVVLALVCVAIRERTKGWAVGTQKLPTQEMGQRSEKTVDQSREADITNEVTDTALAEASMALSHSPEIHDPLLAYIMFMHQEFADIVKRDEYVFARVEQEKILNHYVSLMPKPLFASFNQVSNVIEEKHKLGFIFSMLSSKYPVYYAVSSLVWGLSLRGLR